MNLRELLGFNLFLQIQKRSRKVPSTPRPRSRSAQAPLKISSGADAQTHRHRYHSMPSMPKGHSGLPCRPAHPRAMGFFVMIDQRTKNRVPAPLCARAHAPLRPVSLLRVLLANSLFRFATWSQPIVALKTARTAWSSHHQPCRYVCFGRSPRYNPHRPTSLPYPTL